MDILIFVYFILRTLFSYFNVFLFFIQKKENLQYQ